MKQLAILLSTCAMGLCLFPASPYASEKLASLEARPPVSEKSAPVFFEPQGWAGNYLAGRFGQYHHDWKAASQYMNDVLTTYPDDVTLIKRSMILAMGSGNTDLAMKLAHQNIKLEDDSSLALIFLATESLKKKDYKQASEYIKKIPENGISDFVMPLLYGWSDAALGKNDTESLSSNTIHIHHAI